MSGSNGFGKYEIIFGVGNSPSVHADNGKKDISILGKGPTDGLHDTTLTAETEYLINFSEQQNILLLDMLLNLMHMKLFDCQTAMCLVKMK